MILHARSQENHQIVLYPPCNTKVLHTQFQENQTDVT